MPKRILAVDDESSIRSLIKDVLEKAGYVVETVADGDEVDAKLRTGATESYDLVITDNLMNRIHGPQVLRIVKTYSSELPVMLVASPTLEDEAGVRRLGFDAVLHKPFNIADLVSLVQRLFSDTS